MQVLVRPLKDTPSWHPGGSQRIARPPKTASARSPGHGDIEALIMFFRHRHRIPRLEYIEKDAPRAWPALAAAGFTIERRTPVMITAPGTRLTPRSPAGITIRQATSDADLTAAATVQHHAYQMPHPPARHRLADQPGLPGSRTRRRTDISPYRVHRRHHQTLGLDPLIRTPPSTVTSREQDRRQEALRPDSDTSLT